MIKNFETIFFKDKNILIFFFVYIVYVVLTFIIGLYHEPWADEAQSWLIARDCSFYDIMFTRCSYEGTPFLWFYILKIFILLGWSYEYLFVISWLFSCVGVYLFLFKSKFPNIIKILLPFTYYIFYQYNVVSRSYSLIFPTLCLIAIFYECRFERKNLYCFLLAILASICAYSYVVSFILILFFICDSFYKQTFNKCMLKKILATDIKIIASKIKGFVVKNIPFLILIVYMLFLFCICQKDSDCYYAAIYEPIFSYHFFYNLMLSFIDIFLDVKFFSLSIPVLFLITSVFFFISIKTFCKNKKQVFYFVIINLLLLCVITHIVSYPWHIGIVFLVFIFCCWIFQNENNITIRLKTNKIFYIFWFLVLLSNISFSAITSYYEIVDKYDRAKEIAKFLKLKEFDKQDIIGIGCRLAAIQPYFEKNIFANKKEAYYHWSKVGLIKEIKEFQNLIDNASVVIVEWADFHIIKDYVNRFDNKYKFESCMFTKLNKPFYRSIYILLIKNIK